MQTFLPYEDFVLSATVLDRQRLNRQRVESLMLLGALLSAERSPTLPMGWAIHPAGRMWKGYEEALCLYGVTICIEWKARGYKDTCRNQLLALMGGDLHWEPEMPPWLGVMDFHVSHRAALLAKDPEHYGAFFPGLDPVIDYVWPLSGR